MIAKSEIVKIYETILSVPGMSDEIKVNLKISRKNLLLMTKIIERGLNAKDVEDKSVTILEIMPKETLSKLSEISVELLQRAGLTEINDRLKSF
ncbi:MAG: hypothetical protein QM764_20380 [Chitinophagaceae bacterium]